MCWGLRGRLVLIVHGRILQTKQHLQTMRRYRQVGGGSIMFSFGEVCGWESDRSLLSLTKPQANGSIKDMEFSSFLYSPFRFILPLLGFAFVLVVSVVFVMSYRPKHNARWAALRILVAFIQVGVGVQKNKYYCDTVSIISYMYYIMCIHSIDKYCHATEGTSLIV